MFVVLMAGVMIAYPEPPLIILGFLTAVTIITLYVENQTEEWFEMNWNNFLTQNKVHELCKYQESLRQKNSVNNKNSSKNKKKK